jgi:hypothetical protein
MVRGWHGDFNLGECLKWTSIGYGKISQI